MTPFHGVGKPGLRERYCAREMKLGLLRRMWGSGDLNRWR